MFAGDLEPRSWFQTCEKAELSDLIDCEIADLKSGKSWGGIGSKSLQFRF